MRRRMSEREANSNEVHPGQRGVQDRSRSTTVEGNRRMYKMGTRNVFTPADLPANS